MMNKNVLVQKGIKSFYLTALIALFCLILSAISISFVKNFKSILYIDGSYIIISAITFVFFILFCIWLSNSSIKRISGELITASYETWTSIILSVILLLAIVAGFILSINFKLIKLQQYLHPVAFLLVALWAVYCIIIAAFNKDIRNQLKTVILTIHPNKNVIFGTLSMLESHGCPFCEVRLPWNSQDYAQEDTEFTCPACETSFKVHKSLTGFNVKRVRPGGYHTSLASSAFIKSKSFTAFWGTSIVHEILKGLLLIGVGIYYLKYLESMVTNSNFPSPLDLAILAATLGGFVLIGTFYDKAPEKIRIALKRSAKQLLTSAILFTLEFFLLLLASSITDKVLSWSDWIIVVVTSVIMAFTAYKFTDGLMMLVEIVREL